MEHWGVVFEPGFSDGSVSGQIVAFRFEYLYLGPGAAGPKAVGDLAGLVDGGIESYEVFRRAALHATGVSFTSRIHFGRQLDDEANRYIRFAYSGIDVADIEEGLSLFKEWAER